ncbi:hypothetical protein [Tuwongella immobilis]|uniref:Uncharacterized protein n=1 Tax=Tuwongella immobilis TaxID=692036 RepID=A0A6C2YIZ6_9BACT|nr:hypothetical protein [Tuwongella immobilis]VIP01377.1 unnamed protein product [Tuwongella immobilis]VTR98224.1 unnamed protein product [Tuwongella immobilis]
MTGHARFRWAKSVLWAGILATLLAMTGRAQPPQSPPTSATSNTPTERSEPLSIPAVQERRLGPVDVRLEISRTRLTLSEFAEVQIIVEGPSPVTIQPEPLPLRARSIPFWSLTPLAPDRREPLPNERERIIRRLRLEPFEVGDLLLEWTPLRIRSGRLGQEAIADFRRLVIPVSSALAEPNIDLLRPMIAPPPLPPMPEVVTPRWPQSLLMAVLLVGVLVMAWPRLRRRWRESRERPLPWAVRLHRNALAIDPQWNQSECWNQVAALHQAWWRAMAGDAAASWGLPERLAWLEDRADWPAEQRDHWRQLEAEWEHLRYQPETPHRQQVAETWWMAWIGELARLAQIGGLGETGGNAKN